MKRSDMAVAALALLIAGCADSGNWTKPGATKEVLAADLEACRSEAREATRRDDAINADILASRGNDWQRAGMLSVQQDSMASEKSKHGASVVAGCMSAKGYRQAE
jgi:hypothetical protein